MESLWHRGHSINFSQRDTSLMCSYPLDELRQTNFLKLSFLMCKMGIVLSTLTIIMEIK